MVQLEPVMQGRILKFTYGVDSEGSQGKSRARKNERYRRFPGWERRRRTTMDRPLLGKRTTRAFSQYHFSEALMFTFLLWLFLLFFCWPLAILAIVLYPLVWLFLLPFRLLGIAVEGVLELVKAIIFLPARVLRGPRRAY